ncbi:MAG: hypothetical protein HC817_02530 [Saprospiraceae bacterium]|nr:hypothetical protein [Saprospiraceae bacterium]
MKYFFQIMPILWVIPILSCNNVNQKEPPSVSSNKNYEQPPPKTSEAPDSSAITFTQIEGFYQLDWKALAKTKFNPFFVDSLESYTLIPQFPLAIRQLEGQPVQMSGYVIPVEETGDMQVLVLSANPYTTCFFCGQAGPETVMDIKLKNTRPDRRYKKDDVTTFRGKLKLNDSDYQFFNYILEEAEEMRLKNL